MAHTTAAVGGVEVDFNVELVRERMAKLNLDQRGLADAIGVEERTVRRWLAGDLPKVIALAKMAALFGVDVQHKNASRSLLVLRLPARATSPAHA